MPNVFHVNYCKTTMNNNEADQADELAALASIYPGPAEGADEASLGAAGVAAVVFTPREDGTGGSALVAPALPLAYEGVVLPPAAGVAAAAAAAAPETQRFALQHLPPVELVFTYPPGYPAREPPEAHLAAVWLSPAQLAAAKARLLVLAAESAGSPIVFEWLAFLRDQLLPFLGAGLPFTI
jgi:hypothetical protein